MLSCSIVSLTCWALNEVHQPVWVHSDSVHVRNWQSVEKGWLVSKRTSKNNEILKKLFVAGSDLDVSVVGADVELTIDVDVAVGELLEHRHFIYF